MPGITNGAELIRKLRDSGTGADKLAVARKVLEEMGADATAQDVLAALTDAFPGSVTLEKASQFMASGEYNPTLKKPAPVAIEDQVAPPAKQAGVDRPGVGQSAREEARPTAGKK